MSSVAAAFHAAQTGHVPATAKTAPPRSKAPRRGVTPQPTRPQRALSPAEQLADVARALSPVRFFLRETGTGEDESDYNSFGSLGMANQSTSSTNNNNTSYDYQQEEEWVRAAQAKAKANGHARNGSDAKRRKKAMAEDMPYRPGEDDHAVDSSGESEEGEGIVRSGALDGRAETRGKRKEKGEGYLGMGLGLQQRRKKGRRSDESDGRDHDHGQLDVDGPRVRTPSRSPTPNLLRAFSPALARVSPAPNGRTFQPRRRPSSLRTIITNILHGIVLALRFVVELLGGAIDKLALQPVRSIAGSGKMMMKRAKRDWWKWLGVLLALSMALRLLNRPKGFTPPDLPPASMEELISRLTSLEQALSTLSTSTNGLTEDAHEGKKSIRSMADRVGAVEENLVRERKRLDTEYNSIRSDVSALSSQADTGHKAVASAQSTLKALERVSHDVQALKSRVDKVEKENALDDGRIRSALDRMLPDYMPVKWKSGAIVIEPVFWAELKKIMATKKEVDGLLDAGKLDERLEQWGEKLFDRKATSGLVISRSEFLQVLESEMDILKSKLDERRPPTIPHGDASTSLLQELIDAALLRYSKDTLAKPDYALFTAGARVVPSITSDTLVLKPASALGRWFGGKRDVEGRSPATALYPDNTVGSCWPFKDAQGQLGVLLNRRVIVTDVTVEHAAEELALDVSTAPKLIEVVSAFHLSMLTGSGVWLKEKRIERRFLHISRTILNLRESRCC